MATSLATLRDRVNDEIKIDPNNRVNSATLIDRNINRALYKVQQDLNFSLPENLKVTTVTADSQEKDLPADFQKIAQPNSLKINDSTPLTPERYERILQRRSLSDAGEPYLYYVRWNGTNYVIGFYPSPTDSATVTIPYYALLPELSGTQDSPLPAQYDILLVEYATYLTMRRLPGYEQKAADQRSFYEQDLQNVAANNAIRDASAYDFSYQRWSDGYYYNPRSTGDDYYG